MNGSKARPRVIKVFVHGNPETVAVWGPLLAELKTVNDDPVLCLSPPGFGSPLPEGFTASVEAYRRWLVNELEAIGEPVDLVGHDWGGGHVMNVAMTRADLLRSWATDTCGVFDRQYDWHGLAQEWQTPGVGEAVLESLFSGTVSERADRFVERGLPRPAADDLAAAQGPVMADAILRLYRSAIQPVMLDLGQHLEAAAVRPGLSILATEDDLVGTKEQRRRAAERAGARTHALVGLGHWWMLEDPSVGAHALNSFWCDLAA